MRPSARILPLAVAVLLVTFPLAYASECNIPNAFTSGTPAVAAQVNANFDSVKTAVDNNNSRIAALEAALKALQATITTQADNISTLEITVSDQADTIDRLELSLASLEDSDVLALDPYLTVGTASDSRGPLVQLAGVNLQVVNGQGNTESTNGLGNLIVGYDEQRDSGSDKSGSHYIVLGTHNNYSRYGGVVAGYKNSATGEYSSVTGGYSNTASGQLSSVTGGRWNIASGIFSSVSGGESNTASGQLSSVTGGRNNTASYFFSSVSGGESHEASGIYDWRAGTLFQDE